MEIYARVGLRVKLTFFAFLSLNVIPVKALSDGFKSLSSLALSARQIEKRKRLKIMPIIIDKSFISPPEYIFGSSRPKVASFFKRLDITRGYGLEAPVHSIKCIDK